VRRVYAEMGNFVHEEFDVEDYGYAIVRFKDGSIATLDHPSPRQYKPIVAP